MRFARMHGLSNPSGATRNPMSRKNEIDLLLKRLQVSNNTRRKYLRYVRMFFSWVTDEGHSSGIQRAALSTPADDYNGDSCSPEDTKKLLRYVVEHEKDLIGYYGCCPQGAVLERQHCCSRSSDDDRRRIGLGIRLRQFSAKTAELVERRRQVGAQRFGRQPALVSDAGASSGVCHGLRKGQPLPQDRGEEIGDARPSCFSFRKSVERNLAVVQTPVLRLSRMSLPFILIRA